MPGKRRVERVVQPRCVQDCSRAGALCVPDILRPSPAREGWGADAGEATLWHTLRPSGRPQAPSF